MMLKKKIILAFLFLEQLVGFSQTVIHKDTLFVDPNDDYYQSNLILKYDDVVYEKNIKSVQLYNESFELSQPILALGTDERLKLSFDDLDGDLKDYSLTLIHCNAGWEPSGLMPLEYIDGFEEIEINEFAYSENTFQKYTHYNVYIPSPSTRITKSGNYLLKVFHRNDKSKLVLSKRFMILENKVVIKAQAHPTNTIEYRPFKQEVDFSVMQNEYPIENPYQNMKVVICQNNRWDNAVKTLRPSFINDTEIVYNYEEDNVFTGGSEFRNFDLKSLYYQSERIAKIKTDSTKIDVTLRPDEKRTYLRYSSANDINGNFIIKTTDQQKNSDINGEYAYIHFFLPFTETFGTGNFYVFGAFNGWKCTKDNKMTFNPKRLGYEATLYLKQGYYNYEYVFLENAKTIPDETVIEGMHSETENEYTIYVYYKQPGTFYDRLIGIGHINSVKY